MPHRKTALFLGVLVTFMLACSPPPEKIAEATAPLYVDAIGGGHGPFPCTGTIPERGYVDLFTGANYTGTCQRWRGDMADGSGYQHRGYTFFAMYQTKSMRVSPMGPDQTTVYACDGWVDTNPPYGCAGGPGFATSADVPSISSSWVDEFKVQYTSSCPVTAPFKHLHQCTGSATPEDGSQLATVVITDDFGHPLNEANGSSLAGDCVTYLPPALYSQFTPPPGYLFGIEVATVYTCP